MRLANLDHDLLLSSAAMTFFLFSMYDQTRRNVVFVPIKEKKKGREKINEKQYLQRRGALFIAVELMK